MKFSRSNVAVACALVLAGAVANAELARWVQHIPVASALEAVFFRTIALPAGPVQSRRPPKETVAELTKQISAAPGDAGLVTLRAQEAELNLDFSRAEQDWRTYARLATDKGEGSIALADYYHRRLQPKEELAALLEAANQPAMGRDALNLEAEQRSWKLFNRAVALASAQSLPAETTESIYNAWISRYPANPQPYTRLFDYLAASQQTTKAQQVIDRYAKAFPTDESFVLQSRARLLAPQEALKLYEQNYRPVMPPNVIAQYFQLLNQTRSLRDYLAAARAAVAANPNDLSAATKLFYYYQQQGNLAQAHRALLEYRLRRAQPSAGELLALATLFEQTNNYHEAARHFRELSRLSTAEAEDGYAGLIRILFTAAEQQLPIASSDIGFYKDIATMDPYPGTLNGILSLLYNSTDPMYRYADQERAAKPYFHRMAAAELLLDMEKRFPQSQHLPSLQAQLLDAYARHGENDQVVKRGQQFLSAHPSSPARINVWLLIADAHARRDRVKEEFAVYDDLLKELAGNAKNIPLGSASADIPAALPDPNQPQPYIPPRRPQPVRSAKYAEVLDRYINRLLALKRLPEALALYRREIDRNPNDPGLYERLAEFLNQNKLGAQIEQGYTRAIQQFQEPSWNHKLARWYMRQKQTAAFDKLTRSIVDTFSGTDLDAYFEQVVASSAIDANLYKQINLYAHQRFPHDLVFVKNLLSAYTRRGTQDPDAYMALLRQHWYHDPELRSRFFERLAAAGQLDAELTAVRALQAPAAGDRAATELIARAEIWRSRFESAAPILQSIAADYPAERELNTTTAALLRSLGQTEDAARIARRLVESEPRSLPALTHVGEIYAEREQFDKARPYWNRLAQVEPGNLTGYREAATVYWDYFLFDDALRMIESGRAKLANSAALSYEAGAIYESKRDYTKAITEYVKGARADTNSPSRRRLVRLASRPAHREAIESQTRSLASGPNPDQGAWDLRVALLEEQNRRDDIAALLTATTASTSSFDMLARVDQVAERNGLSQLREQALTRQAALTTDPVERTRLRLMLARLAEDRKDLAASQQFIDTAYKENPNIVGVVRSTVDYYWRINDRKRAVDTLEQAAGRSNPSFKRAFTLEAGRKATEAGDYARARTLLQPLLTIEPSASDLVTAMADTYARQGDDKALREFYVDRLRLSKSPEEQATLHRSLIPVLTRMKDYRAAVDEYIAILNKFPEDEALVGEAARYSRNYNVTERLTAFYTKAAADSPRDPRWPMVLARAYVAFENLPAAVDNYTKALAIRPDRSDLLSSRAALEERLLRFSEAAGSYTKLYDLLYKDPQMMVKVAENRARLGQKTQAIGALRTAFLEGKTAKADAYFEIASKLEQWGWLQEALQYAADGRKADPQSSVGLHARIATRLRQYTELDSDEAIYSAAQVVREYYTPEEKEAFGEWLLKLPLQDKSRFALAAGLQDVAVRDLHARIAADPNLALSGEGQQLIQIQQQRLRYAELAPQLEAFWKVLPASDQRDQVMVQAIDNWRLAANPAEELRARQILFQRGNVPDPDRYAELLSRVAPDRYVQAGSVSNTGLRDAVIALAYRKEDPLIALRIISTRGSKQQPVWTPAYTALTGLYFNHREPAITAAFNAALGPRTIGEQLAAKPDRTQQLYGDVWFYYGARFGEFTNSEDYLASELEGRPASAEPYVRLGDYYRDAKAPVKALEEYARALQIDPSSAETHNRIAAILVSQNRLAEAQSHWQEALRLWAELQDRRVPETFWTGVSQTIQGAGPALRTEIDKLLRTYIRRNGAYRFDSLLAAIWKTSANETDAARWIIDLSSAAVEPSQFLASIVSEDIIGPAERELIYAKLLDLAQREAERRAGDARNDARWRLQDYQLRYIRALLSAQQYPKATEAIRAIPQDMRQSMSLVPIELQIAAATKQLDEILKRDDLESDQLREAAATLRLSGDDASARRILDFFYTRELDRSNLDPSIFLGLAEVRLESNDVAGAVSLLRRMTLVAGEPFETLTPAAELLAKFNRHAEAREFWEARVKAVPWDYNAATKSAIAKSDAATLRNIAATNLSPYASRVEAAKASRGGATLGSGELDALASTAPIPVASIEKPYYYDARLRAAEQSTDTATRVRLLRDAIAIDPTKTNDRVSLFRAYYQSNQFEQAVSLFGRAAPDKTITRELATAYRKLGDLERARPLLIQLNDKAEIAAIDAEMERRNENRRRAPQVHDGVDQPLPVRPRI